MPQLVALGVRPPQIDTIGAYQQGAANALGMDAKRQEMAQSAETHQSNMKNADIARKGAEREQALQGLQVIGSIALGAMDGKIDGEVDPQKFEQGLDLLEQQGINVSQFRGRPEIAPVVARSSLTALQQLQAAKSDRDYELAMQKFQMDVAQAAQGPGPASPLGKLAQDYQGGLISKDQYEAAVAKATQSSSGITVSPDGTVQIGGSGSPQFQKETDKKDAEAIQTIRDQAGVAQELRSIAGQMTAVLDDVGYTGPGGEVYGKVDDFLGILEGESGPRGAFRQMSMDAQLAMTEKTKGAITDREMGMFKAAVPGLAQTKDGNRAMIEIMKAAAARLEQRASFFEQYRRARGTLDGATEAWGKYLDENPLIESDKDGVTMVSPKKRPEDYLPKAEAREITSKDQYDALPPGAEFIWKGRRGRKPDGG